MGSSAFQTFQYTGGRKYMMFTLGGPSELTQHDELYVPRREWRTQIYAYGTMTYLGTEFGIGTLLDLLPEDALAQLLQIDGVVDVGEPGAEDPDPLLIINSYTLSLVDIHFDFQFVDSLELELKSIVLGTYSGTRQVDGHVFSPI